jgi:hypothetical protein
MQAPAEGLVYVGAFDDEHAVAQPPPQVPPQGGGLPPAGG